MAETLYCACHQVATQLVTIEVTRADMPGSGWTTYQFCDECALNAIDNDSVLSISSL